MKSGGPSNESEIETGTETETETETETDSGMKVLLSREDPREMVNSTAERTSMPIILVILTGGESNRSRA